MELFSIERYNGDTLSTNNIEDDIKESKRMKKLLKQAKGRKRQRQSIGKQNSDVEDGLTSETSPKVKVSKFKGKSVSVSDQDNKNLLPSKTNEINETTFDQDERNNDDISTTNDQNIDNEECSIERLIKSEKNTDVASNNEITVIGGQLKKKTQNSVQRVLPKWLANPSYFTDNVQDNLILVNKLELLDQKLMAKLTQEGIQHFFPVQQVIIPEVLSCWEEKSPFGRGGYLPSDICVCAPTGSGKTLAYILPIIQLLQCTAIRQLSALVIVPTKDLATQVWNVFNIYATGTCLKIGLANGLKNLQRESEQLGKPSAAGYVSHVNILVATPGRLVEHISSSVGFTLKFLRFFVIDEADRLLSEPYFGWLSKVYGSVYSMQNDINRAIISCARSAPQLLTPSWCEKIQQPLQKLLFSATLTQNPEKLAPLQLYKPKFFTVAKSSKDHAMPLDGMEGGVCVGHTPTTLDESMYICNSGGKPLVLLYLLTEMKLDRVLCFTSSVEATHRLYLLIKHFGGITLAEYSSTSTAVQRKAILNDFNSGEIKLIICSDAMARGLDLERVQYVVSYDPPVSSKTYIHRVGRTARAGKTGNAITLLRDAEVFHFKKMLKSLNKLKLPKHSIKDNVLQPLMARYETALEQLKDDVISNKKPGKRQNNTRKKIK